VLPEKVRNLEISGKVRKAAQSGRRQMIGPRKKINFYWIKKNVPGVVIAKGVDNLEIVQLQLLLVALDTKRKKNMYM